MKKTYEAPSLEITKFETENVLNASVQGNISGGGNTLRPGPIRP